MSIDPLRDRLDALPADETVLVSGERSYDGDRFVETAFRTGNFLRHCGVHGSSTVEIVPEAAPETVFGLLGTILLGGTVSFEPGTHERPAARLGPTPELRGTEFPAGCKPIGFGAPPENPSWAYFEQAVWSENPSFPVTALDPDRQVFATVSTTGLEELLERAEVIADRIEPTDTVAIRAAIGDSGTIITGVFAPLISGATLLLPDADQRGTLAVSSNPAPEPRTLAPDTI